MVLVRLKLHLRTFPNRSRAARTLGKYISSKHETRKTCEAHTQRCMMPPRPDADTTTLCRVAVVQSIVPQSSGHFLLLTQIQSAVGHLRLEQTEDVGIVNRGEPFDSWGLRTSLLLGTSISCLSPVLFFAKVNCEYWPVGDLISIMLWPQRSAYVWKTLPTDWPTQANQHTRKVRPTQILA